MSLIDSPYSRIIEQIVTTHPAGFILPPKVLSPSPGRDPLPLEMRRQVFVGGRYTMDDWVSGRWVDLVYSSRQSVQLEYLEPVAVLVDEHKKWKNTGRLWGMPVIPHPSVLPMHFLVVGLEKRPAKDYRITHTWRPAGMIYRCVLCGQVGGQEGRECRGLPR